MADQPPELKFNTRFDPETGRRVDVAAGIARVTAPNASPYTFTGTNTFILGHAQVLVVDPGPDLPAHFTALINAIGARRVEAIVLTHTHRDHCDLVRRLQTATKAPLWFGGQHRLSRPARAGEQAMIARESDWDLVPDRVLADRERFAAAGLEIDVYATPGHCANHLCFGISGTPYLLSGDHVMGWNSTLVPVPDGSMADYLSSLKTIAAAPYSIYLPAHGPAIPDGPAFARALLSHRQLRNAQIVEAVADGTRTIGGLLRRIYPKLSPGLAIAARMTIAAHVEYLAAREAIRVRQTLLGPRLSAVR